MNAFDFHPSLVLPLALALEAVFGYPPFLHRRLGHPVEWIGRMIAMLDRAWNREADPAYLRRLFGIAALATVLAATVATALALQAALRHLPGGWLAEAALVATLLAQRSLYVHVAAVAKAMETGGLDAARRAVSHIVGRDPDRLDWPGVARAAIESLAENFGDGVVAPVFWYLVAGLPGIAAYKAINTADSMIGHRTARHAAFGWAAARLDDLANWVPARLGAALVIAAAAIAPAAKAGEAAVAVWKDARRHRSPNAGWYEAAMAGALGLRLAGPRIYGGEIVEDAWMGRGTEAAGPAHIRAALRLYATAAVALWASATAAALTTGG